MDTEWLELAIDEGIRVYPHSQGMPGSRIWTVEEVAYLREQAGVLYDVEIAEKLGRSLTAIKVRRTREQLPAPRYHQDFVTANVAAQMLGVDQHKITGWIDRGLIPGEVHQKRNTEHGTACASGMFIRRIRVTTLRRWCTRPHHWIYFDPQQVVDPDLRSLILRAVALWGDEWWTVRQVADFHGVDPRWIGQKLWRKEIPGLQAFNLGGRHPDAKWSFWFIRKSDALRARFVHGHGNMQKIRAEELTWSTRADAWILRARANGMTFDEIAVRMGPVWSAKRVSYRYKNLKRRAQ